MQKVVGSSPIIRFSQRPRTAGLFVPLRSGERRHCTRLAWMDEEALCAHTAATESVFRSVNEKVEDINRAFSLATESMSVVCECGDINCTQQLEIDLATYEAVRSDPTWF